MAAVGEERAMVQQLRGIVHHLILVVRQASHHYCSDHGKEHMATGPSSPILQFPDLSHKTSTSLLRFSGSIKSERMLLGARRGSTRRESSAHSIHWHWQWQPNGCLASTGRGKCNREGIRSLSDNLAHSCLRHKSCDLTGRNDAYCLPARAL